MVKKVHVKIRSKEIILTTKLEKRLKMQSRPPKIASMTRFS